MIYSDIKLHYFFSMAFREVEVNEIAHDHSRSRRRDARDLASGKRTSRRIQQANSIFEDTAEFRPTNLNQSLAAMAGTL